MRHALKPRESNEEDSEYCSTPTEQSIDFCVEAVHITSLPPSKISEEIANIRQTPNIQEEKELNISAFPLF